MVIDVICETSYLLTKAGKAATPGNAPMPPTSRPRSTETVMIDPLWLMVIVSLLSLTEVLPRTSKLRVLVFRLLYIVPN